MWYFYVVAAAHGLVQFGGTFKFTEYLFISLTHDIGQDIQPAAVGHANHHFLHIIAGSGVDNSVEGRDGGFAPFEGKTFLPDILGMEKLFQT